MDAQLKIQEGNSNLHEGRVLSGRYELLLPMARGGMGVVWLARLKGTRGFRKLVAVKTLLKTEANSTENLEMLMEIEANVASLIHHPNVVETMEFAECEGTVYLVMELINGDNLHQVAMRAAEKGGMPRHLAVNILGQVCRGLHAAHELLDHRGEFADLVHRDLSPQNILIAYDGLAKIIDFGVAKVGFADTLTQAGTVKGKLAFMAPEQIINEGIDRRADLFSLGVIAYILLVGKHPFKGSNERDTIRNVLNEEPPTAPSAALPGFPEKLEAVIMKALQKEKDNRWGTALEFLRALEEAMPEAFASGVERDMRAYLATLLADNIAKRKQLIQQAEALYETTSVSNSGIVTKQPMRPPSMSADTRVIEPQMPKASPVPAIPQPRKSKALLYGAVLTSLAAVGGGLLFSAIRPAHVAPSPVLAPAAQKPKGAVGEYAPMVVFEGPKQEAQEEAPAASSTPAPARTAQAVGAHGAARPTKKETDNPYDDRIDIAKAIATAQETQEAAAPAPEPVTPPPAPVVVKEAPTPPPAPAPSVPRNVAARVGHALLKINPNADPYRATVPRSLASLGEFSTSVRICVAPSGAVQGVTVLKPLGEAIDNRVVAALRRWQYKPLMENGQAVSFCYSLAYSF